MSSEEESDYRSIPNIPSAKEAAEVNNPDYQPSRLSRFVRKITRPWIGGVAGLSAATIAGMANPTEIHAEAPQPTPTKPGEPKPAIPLFDSSQYQIGQPTISRKEMTEKEDLSAPMIIDFTNPKRDPSEVIKYNPTRALQVILPDDFLSVPIEVDSTTGIHPVIIMDIGDYYQQKMSREEFARFINKMRPEERFDYTRSKIIVPNSEDPNWESHWTDDDEQFKIRIFSPTHPELNSLTIPIQVTNNNQR